MLSALDLCPPRIRFYLFLITGDMNTVILTVTHQQHLRKLL